MSLKKKNFLIQPHSFLYRHRIAIGVFSVLVLYGLVIVRRCSLPRVEKLCYYFHAVDFSLGFCSKFLPGAIYNLFVKTPSPLSATVYESVLLVLFYAVVSIMLERLVNSAEEKNRPVLFLLLAFYLTGPATFAPYSYELGMLDVYWLFTAAPFLLLLRNRYARILLPLFFAVAVMIHFGAMITYVPFFAFLILYELTRAKKKRDRRQLTAVFLAGVLLAVGTVVYFGINDKNNVRVNIEEFNRIMESRGVEHTKYYDNALFRNSVLFKDGRIDEAALREAMGLEEDYIGAPNEPLFPDDHNNPFLRMINTVVYEFQIHFYIYSHFSVVKRTFSQFFLLAVVLSPIFIFFWRFFISRFRETGGNRLSRFLYACFLLFTPFTTVGSLFVSTDSTRWMYHCFMVLFTFLLYLVYREKTMVLDVLSGMLRRIPGFAVGVYYLIYFFTVLDPYV